MDSGIIPESTRLGRYRIVKRLGGGETSEVLLAISQGPHGFERIVVLKRLLPDHTDVSMGRVLATEAVAYARLTHPAIVRLYDFFDLEGQAVLVVEYVDGPSLAELQATLRARQEALSDPAALYIASRVFGALAAAHSARDPRSGEFAPVIHRDVSPGSVLLPWDGFVKLGDFGFAKVKGLTGDGDDTRHGVLKGTLGYMAPEQVLGEPVTPRTDVYAGCLLLREMLVAAPAFPPKMPELELLKAMAEARLEPIETLRGGLSPALADAMRRGLARDPEERTLTAAEMGRVLRQETDLAIAQMSLVDALARVRPPSEMRASTPPAGTRAFTETPSSGTLRFERMHLPPEAMPSDATASGRDSDSHPTLRFETPHEVIMVGRTDPPFVAPPPSDRRYTRAVVVATGLVGLAACVALFGLLRSPPPLQGDQVAPKPSAVAEIAVAAAPSSPPTSLVPPPLLVAPPLPVAPPPPVSPPSPVPTPSAPPRSPAPVSTLGELVTPAHARSHRVFVDGRYAAPRSGATLSVHCGAHTVRIGSKGREQRVDVPCGGSIAVDVP